MSAPTDSILNSIKGRVWLAASGLAVLNCFCGLGAYLAVSFLVQDTFITVFVTFFLLAFITMIFGWWLASDVVRPIDAVTLLAKALERSPNATLPRTTGSSETDELLRTLHRNSQQLQNLISMMDAVAAGRTDVVSAPLENSDKLSASFQKLVSRVTDSIAAKRELDGLQAALTKLNSEIAGIRGGRLDVQVGSEHHLTKEIADTVRFLANRLEQLARGAQISSVGAGSAVAEAKRALRAVIENRYERTAHLSRNLSDLKELPAKAQAVTRSADAAIAAFESVICSSDVDRTAGLQKASENNERLTEAIRKVQKLRTRVAELPQLGRAANDISRKSKLIALNTAIQSESAADTLVPNALIADEVSSLSQRAESLNNEIRTLSDSITSEVGDLSSAFAAISLGSSEAIRNYEHTVQTVAEFRRLSAELSGVRPKLNEFNSEQSLEGEKLADILTALSNDRSGEDQLRETEQQLQRLVGLVENLADSISDLRVTAKPGSDNLNGAALSGLPFERVTAESLEAAGEN